MLQVCLLEDEHILEVEVVSDFSLELLKNSLKTVHAVNLLKGGQSLKIDFKFEKLVALNMVGNRIPKKGINELQKEVINSLSQLALASAYLTHEYCHLYSRVAIGINAKYLV